MSEHTPGPWKQSGEDGRVIRSNSNQIIAHIRSLGFADKNNNKMKANSLLISAAPELLAALQVMVRDYSTVHGIGDLEMQPAIYQANQAIENATGEKP